MRIVQVPFASSPVKTATRRPDNRRIPIARDRLDKIREILGG
jgi:hypothetical protein